MRNKTIQSLEIMTGIFEFRYTEIAKTAIKSETGRLRKTASVSSMLQSLLQQTGKKKERVTYNCLRFHKILPGKNLHSCENVVNSGFFSGWRLELRRMSFRSVRVLEQVRLPILHNRNISDFQYQGVSRSSVWVMRRCDPAQMLPIVMVMFKKWGEPVR